LTVSLQEATFEREKGKFEEGLADFRHVLEAQRDLDQARVRLLTSKFNQLSAQIDLANLTGTIFERHGIDSRLPNES
jgi:outer membrane protein TolC